MLLPFIIPSPIDSSLDGFIIIIFFLAIAGIPWVVVVKRD